MTLSKDTKPLYPYSVDKHFFHAGDIELVINRSVLVSGVRFLQKGFVISLAEIQICLQRSIPLVQSLEQTLSFVCLSVFQNESPPMQMNTLHQSTLKY